MNQRFVLELDQEELLAVCKALNVAAYYAPVKEGSTPIHSVFGKATKLLPPGLYDEGSERAQRLLAKVQAGAGDALAADYMRIADEIEFLMISVKHKSEEQRSEASRILERLEELRGRRVK